MPENNKTILMPENNSRVERVEPTREWYEQEIKRLHIENEKLKKLVDILLERETYEINKRNTIW